MRKRYLTVLIIVPVLIVAIIYFLTLPSPPFSNLTGPENQENQENRSSFKFPFIFPWQTSDKPSGSGGAGGGSGSGEGGEGSGGSSGSSSNQTTSTPKINYTLSIDSSPSGFRVIPFYYKDNILQNDTYTTPSSLDIESDTIVCLVEITNFGGFIWKLDDGSCIFSTCYGYNNGCNIVMSGPHNVTLLQES